MFGNVASRAPGRHHRSWVMELGLFLHGSLGDYEMRVLPIIIFAFSIVSLAGVTYYFELKKAKNEHSTIAGRNFEIPREASKVAPQEAEIGTVKLYTSIGVTTVVLVACLFVMLASRYSPDEKHWAYATLGTLIGYWLKT